MILIYKHVYIYIYIYFFFFFFFCNIYYNYILLYYYIYYIILIYIEYETAICSIQEFIYSYRDKKESPFPNYTSHQAVNALNMIKRLKNELSSGINIY